MRAIVSNKIIVLKDPEDSLKSYLTRELAYTDKSKQYQIKRMSRSPWANQDKLAELRREAKGNLLKKTPEGHLVMPSGLFYLLKDKGLEIDDRRTLTGIKTSYPWHKKPYDLRDYQREAVDLINSNYRGLINLATSLGKTLVAVHAVKENKTNALIVCPSESIAKQFLTEMAEAFGANRVGMYGDGKKKIAPITIGIAASVCNNIDEFKKANFGLIIFDEVHHIAATTFYSIVMGLGDCGKIFGLTATDFRADGKDIMIFAGVGEVVISKDVLWGVKNGWLAKPEFVIRYIDTSHIKDCGDDKLRNYKHHVLHCDEMKDAIRKDIEDDMKAGRSVLCLVDEIAHGEELAKQLGIPFATGKDKESVRYVKQLNDGKIQGLIGTDSKVGEGTNTKNVDVLVLANFCGGKGPVIQSIGRGLRKQGTKTKCIIRDYVPYGSEMLTRHALNRIDLYKDITDDIEVIK